MPTLATTVDGLRLPNPFVIASGPPGTNLNVITRAFREGWGAVIAKTVSLDSSKVVNVAPRYAKLFAADGKEPIGWENIELISDRPFKIWLDEFKKCKDQFPDGVLIARSTNCVDAIRIRWLRRSVNRLPEAATHGFPMGSSLVASATIPPLLLGTVDTSLNSLFLIGFTVLPHLISGHYLNTANHQL